MLSRDLVTCDRLGEIRANPDADDPDWGTVPSESTVPSRLKSQYETERPDVSGIARSPEVEADNPLVTPPFLGSRIVKGLSLDEIAGYLNETALFRNQWGFRPEAGEDDAAFKERLRADLRDQLAKARADDLLVPQVVYGYYPANGDGTPQAPPFLPATLRAPAARDSARGFSRTIAPQPYNHQRDQLRY